MSWINRYHEDHMSVLTLLAGLEGNIKDLEIGQERPYMMIEFDEIGKIIKNIIIPHFHKEEQSIYPKVASLNENGKLFIDNMLAEHQKLYTAFDQYIKALESENKKELIASGKIIVEVLKNHIIKEEKAIPNFLEK